MNTTRMTLLARLDDRQDSQAWREFDAIYRPMLARFAQSYGVAGQARDDVVQECMTAILRHVGRFRPQQQRGSFRAWLRRLVINRVINDRRDRHEAEAESGQLSGLASHEPGPEEVFDRICREEQIRYCLDDIRGEVESSTFEAYRLYVMEGHEVKDVCRTLSITPEQLYTIKWRLTRKVAQRLEALEI